MATAVQKVEKHISDYFPYNSDRVNSSGVGTKMVTLLSRDGDTIPRKEKSDFNAAIASAKGAVNAVMAKIVNVSLDDDLKFMEVNWFFVQTASNWWGFIRATLGHFSPTFLSSPQAVN